MYFFPSRDDVFFSFLKNQVFKINCQYEIVVFVSEYFLKTNNVYDNNYKETFLYNKENYYCIKIIYKSLFYNIIKLKVLLKRIRMKIHNKKMAHLFLLSTLDISSKTNIFKPSLFSLTKKNIFKYIV